jgi:hypothetical protein
MISYNHFASRINFFEFIQEEFFEPHFDTNNYEAELSKVSSGVSTDILVRELETLPRIFDIAEEFFQLKRFTDTQYTHFLFDVSKLNTSDMRSFLRYADVSLMYFENDQRNTLFTSIYESEPEHSDDIDRRVAILKKTVVNYISTILKNKNGRNFLYHHISNSIGTRYRIASYLIENLHADKHFVSTDLRKFLSLKRVPRDGKGIHGKYGTYRIKKVFADNGIRCVNDHLNSKTLSLSDNNLSDANTSLSGWTYVSEKMITGIKKRKDGKLKKFDFIILKDGVPAYCIETNFYSTTGTKIGINIGEYTDLKEDINIINRREGARLKFCWVTDGNHWLSSEGESGFNELKQRYFTENWELLNYNLLSDSLPTMTEM